MILLSREGRRRSPAPQPCPADRPSRTVQVSRRGREVFPGLLTRPARSATLSTCSLQPSRSRRRSRSCSASWWCVAATSAGSAGCSWRRASRSGCSSEVRRPPAPGAVSLVIDQLAQGSWIFLFLWTALIAYLVPDGRPLSRRWRLWIRIGLAGAAAVPHRGGRRRQRLPAGARPRAAAALAPPAAVGPARAARPAARRALVLRLRSGGPQPTEAVGRRGAATASVAGLGRPRRPARPARHVGQLLRSGWTRMGHHRHADRSQHCAADHHGHRDPSPPAVRHPTRVEPNRDVRGAPGGGGRLVRADRAGRRAGRRQRHGGRSAGRRGCRCCGAAGALLAAATDRTLGLRLPLPAPPGSPAARGPGRCG